MDMAILLRVVMYGVSGKHKAVCANHDNPLVFRVFRIARKAEKAAKYARTVFAGVWVEPTLDVGQSEILCLTETTIMPPICRRRVDRNGGGFGDQPGPQQLQLLGQLDYQLGGRRLERGGDRDRERAGWLRAPGHTGLRARCRRQLSTRATTMMNGVVGTEIEVLPGALEFILPFF